MKSTKSTGFTLIELVITVAILAIIVALALPSYTNYMFRIRRADAKDLILRIAAAQERTYTNYNRYANTVTGAAPGGLGFSAGGDSTKDGTYTVAIEAIGAPGTPLAAPFQTYQLSATPTGIQAPDKCKVLSVDSTGKKDKTGDETNGKCW
ncbi:MAG: type IV pilin protein [Tahibacter sp.]